jgi:hypothetical protein
LLTAIEEDRYEMLPPGLYLRGFLVAYAKYLGLDPNDVLLRYKKYLEELNIFKEEPLEPKKLEPPKHALFPNKRATLYLLLVILFTVTLFATFLITYLPQLSFPAVPGQKDPMLARIPSRSHMPEEGTTQIEMPESKKIEGGDTIGRDCPIFEVIKAETGTVIGQEGNRLTLRGRSREFTCSSGSWSDDSIWIMILSLSAIIDSVTFYTPFSFCE